MLAVLLAAETPHDIIGRPTQGDNDGVAERIRSGDEHALEQLFRRLAFPLGRFAQRIGVSASDANPLVADVFYTLWERRTALPSDVSLDAYLFRAVRNQALNHIRGVTRAQRREAVVARWTPDIVAAPDTQTETTDLVERVRALVAALPESQRTALFLRYTREMSIDETATTMGVTAGAVKMLLQRGLRTLRTQAGGLFDAL